MELSNVTTRQDKHCEMNYYEERKGLIKQASQKSAEIEIVNLRIEKKETSFSDIESTKKLIVPSPSGNSSLTSVIKGRGNPDDYSPLSTINKCKNVNSTYDDQVENNELDTFEDEHVLRSSHQEAQIVTGKSEIPNQFVPYRDPSHFPLEKYTDGHYGASSSDPTKIDYIPESLRKMKIVGDQTYRLDNHKKFIFIGIGFTFFLIIGIVVGIVIDRMTHAEEKLEKNERNTVIKPPPDNFEIKCSISNVKTLDGRKECNDICKNADCCMAAGEYSCFMEEEDMCGMYSFCANLHLEEEGIDSDIESIDSGIEITDDGSEINAMIVLNCQTTPKELSKDPPTLDLCSKACKCCNYDNDEKQHIHCSHYDCTSFEFCTALLTYLEFPPLPLDYSSYDDDLIQDDNDLLSKEDLADPEYISRSCKDISTIESREKCEFLCDDYRCCFDQFRRTKKCYDKVICSQYSSCSVLKDWEESEIGNKWTPPAIAAAGLCAADNIKIPGGHDQCKVYCKNHMCCFHEEPNNCNEIDCRQYIACKILTQDGV